MKYLRYVINGKNYAELSLYLILNRLIKYINSMKSLTQITSCKRKGISAMHYFPCPLECVESIVVCAAILAETAVNIFEYILNSPSIYLLSWLNTTVKMQAFTLPCSEAADARGGEAR